MTRYHFFFYFLLLLVVTARAQENPRVNIQGVQNVVAELEVNISEALESAGYKVAPELKRLNVTPLDQYQWHFLILVDTSQALPGSPHYSEFCSSVIRYFLYRRVWAQERGRVSLGNLHLFSSYPYQLDLYKEGQQFVQEGVTLDAEALRNFPFTLVSVPVRADNKTAYVGGKDFQGPRSMAVSEAEKQSDLPLIVIQIASQAASDPVIGRDEKGHLVRNENGNRRPANEGALGGTQGLKLAGDFVPYPTSSGGTAYVLAFVPGSATQTPSEARSLDLSGVKSETFLKDAYMELNKEAVADTNEKVASPIGRAKGEDAGTPFWIVPLLFGLVVMSLAGVAIYLASQKRTVYIGPGQIPVTVSPLKKVSLLTKNGGSESPAGTIALPLDLQGGLQPDSRIAILGLSFLTGELVISAADGLSMTVDDLPDLRNVTLKAGETVRLQFTDSASDKSTVEFPVSVTN
jgi:hypothetical protein